LAHEIFTSKGKGLGRDFGIVTLNPQQANSFILK